MSVTLAILGTSVLTNCSKQGEVETAAYDTVQACVLDRKFTQAVCEKSFAAAKAESARNAPPFSSKGDCEDEFGDGNCQPTPRTHASGGIGYVPYMRGFLIGRDAQRVDGVYYPAVDSQALYRSVKPSRFVNGGGNFVSVGTGGFKMSPNSDALSRSGAHTTTIGRGMFGARGGGSSG